MAAGNMEDDFESYFSFEGPAYFAAFKSGREKLAKIMERGQEGHELTPEEEVKFQAEQDNIDETLPGSWPNNPNDY